MKKPTTKLFFFAISNYLKPCRLVQPAKFKKLIPLPNFERFYLINVFLLLLLPLLNR